MQDHFPAMFSSTGDFQEPCPRCAETLADSTAVEQDEGMLFYRVWFKCPACGYWLCTRRETFAVLGPAPRAGDPVPPYLAQADQRIRHDLTLRVVRQLMPSGVQSYEAGCVYLADENRVIKLWSDFEVAGLHQHLALLAQGYIQQGDVPLGRRALELAVDAVHSAKEGDPTLSADDPENLQYVGWILYNLSVVYRQEGRLKEARAAYAQARNWAPELFPAQGH